MEQNKRLRTESETVEQQQIYQDMVRQPLAPIVLRVGVINLSSNVKNELLQAAIARILDDISQVVLELAKQPTAKQIYSSDKPTVRLVSSYDLKLPKNDLLRSEYFLIQNSPASNQQDSPEPKLQEMSENHFRIDFDASLQETRDDEYFVAKQVAAHSDVILVVADDSRNSEELIARIFSDESEFGNVPLLLQVETLTSDSSKAEVIFPQSTSESLLSCLSEILLFDSLLGVLPSNEVSSESKLKSHTLKRIADFVVEDSMIVNQEQPDFDYQGPIKVKRSLLSWRNVFTRFINFLSPIKKQPALTSQTTNQHTDGADNNLSAMRRSKSCQYLYALFMRSDQLAVQYANAHRSSFILIYCLGAFALINAAIAIGFSEIGWLALTSALAEFFALVAIFLIYRNDHKKRYHIKWLEYRSLAEILRVSPHLNSLGMVFTSQGLDRHRSKEDESNLSAHSVGRTWLIIYSETVKRWLDFNVIKISQETLKQGRSFLTDKLIAGQVSYHYKNAHRMHYAGHSLGKFSFILFVFAFVFVSGKLVTKFLSGMGFGLDPTQLHHIGHYLGFLAAICPMLGSAAFAIRNHAEFDISSQRSQTMLKKLNLQLEAFQGLGQQLPYQKLQDTCQQTALIMQSETADWLEIYEVKETEPA